MDNIGAGSIVKTHSLTATYFHRNELLLAVSNCTNVSAITLVHTSNT